MIEALATTAADHPFQRLLPFVLFCVAVTAVAFVWLRGPDRPGKKTLTAR